MSADLPNPEGVSGMNDMDALTALVRQLGGGLDLSYLNEEDNWLGRILLGPLGTGTDPEDLTIQDLTVAKVMSRLLVWTQRYVATTAQGLQ